jgi:hypothetical protein
VALQMMEMESRLLYDLLFEMVNAKQQHPVAEHKVIAKRLQ